MAAVSAPVVAEGSSLRFRVAALRDSYAALWAGTPEDLPPLGPRVGLRRHFRNARAAARLIDTLAAELEQVAGGEQERERWRESVRDRLQAFGDEHLGWPVGYRRLVLGDAYFAASVAFAREARAFAPELSLENLWQALRNVWIGNSLQMVLDLPVRLSPGLFAYSMIYPLTDNLLDDPTIGHEAKRAFNRRLGRRLAGEPVSAGNAAEADVFRLIGRIEDEFPRQRFEDVHESLLAIHAGQVCSLRQQDDVELTDAEILGISCEKGGASVLADLYLVTGAPRPEPERFAFGYGVFLQLLDDLQDVTPDSAAGHQTLFTRAAARGPLDAPAARLARYIDHVLDAQELLGSPEFDDRRDLIRRNCHALLVGAVAEQPRLFTHRFRRALARRWPFSLRATRRLRRRADRRFREAGRRLHRRTGAPSLLDWALDQAAPAAAVE